MARVREQLLSCSDDGHRRSVWLATEFLLEGHWLLGDLPLCRNPWPDDEQTREQWAVAVAAAATSAAAPGGDRGLESGSASSDECCTYCAGEGCIWCRDDASMGCDQDSFDDGVEEWREEDSDGSDSSQLRHGALRGEISDSSGLGGDDLGPRVDRAAGRLAARYMARYEAELDAAE